MLTLVLYGLLAIVIAGLLFLVAARFLPAGEQIAPPLRDEPPWDLPADRGLRPEDVDSVRLPVALRGYRFAETDILLDRLAGELRERDAEIAELRRLFGGSAASEGHVSSEVGGVPEVGAASEVGGVPEIGVVPEVEPTARPAAGESSEPATPTEPPAEVPEPRAEELEPTGDGRDDRA